VRIVVDDLPEQGMRRAGHAEVELGVGEDGEPLVATQPVNYDLGFSRLGSTVTIAGHLDAVVEAACGRCAERFEVPVARDFEAVFVTADTGETDRAAELDARDLDLDYYEGGAIDGLRLLAEQIFLELPMKLLCAEDCKGLCIQCGANLNRTDCDCEAEVDPRWASLKGLADQL